MTGESLPPYFNGEGFLILELIQGGTSLIQSP